MAGSASNKRFVDLNDIQTDTDGLAGAVHVAQCLGSLFDLPADKVVVVTDKSNQKAVQTAVEAGRRSRQR